MNCLNSKYLNLNLSELVKTYVTNLATKTITFKARSFQTLFLKPSVNLTGNSSDSFDYTLSLGSFETYILSNFAKFIEGFLQSLSKNYSSNDLM